MIEWDQSYNKKTDSDVLLKSKEDLKAENDRLDAKNSVVQDEYFENTPFCVEKAPKEPELGMCKKCKEWTFLGNSCCGDENVHTF